MSKSYARGYLSSDGQATTSAANEDIIPVPPINWTEKYRIKKISFFNHTRCTIIVNGTSKIVLEPKRGFESCYDGVETTSFVVEEAGTVYECIMAY